MVSEEEGQAKAARHNAQAKPYGGQPQRWYYQPWGDKLLLPCDQWSLERYMSRGLSLTPPANPTPRPEHVDQAAPYAGRTPNPLVEKEISEDTVLAVVKAMEKAGYSFVKTADTPTESETKLQVSQVSAASNGAVPSKKE